MAERKVEIWDIYDERGVFQQRTIRRGSTLKEGDYHLVVQVWPINRNGEYLIQKRSENVDSYPGIWAATAGSVLSGEDSLHAVIRELQEEIGINVQPRNLRRLFQTKWKHLLADIWIVEKDISNIELRLQESEVSATMWASPQKILEMAKSGDLLDYGKEYFSTLCIRSVD